MVAPNVDNNFITADVNFKFIDNDNFSQLFINDDGNTDIELHLHDVTHAIQFNRILMSTKKKNYWYNGTSTKKEIDEIKLSTVGALSKSPNKPFIMD